MGLERSQKGPWRGQAQLSGGGGPWLGLEQPPLGLDPGSALQRLGCCTFLGLRLPISKMGTIIVPSSPQDLRRLNKGTDTFHSHNNYEEGSLGTQRSVGGIERRWKRSTGLNLETHWVCEGDSGSQFDYHPFLPLHSGPSQTQLRPAVPPNQLCGFTHLSSPLLQKFPNQQNITFVTSFKHITHI